MNKTKPSRGFRVLTAITALVGPAAAIRSEKAPLLFFLNNPVIYELWFVAILAALGVGIGIVSFIRGAKIIGAACILSNSAVLALYGFIVAYQH
jgi:hypothetical protein